MAHAQPSGTRNNNNSATNNNDLARTNSQERSDLVAYWSVPLCDGVHTIEFEHGTTTGKRVLRVDGKEVIRRDWMFRLVGEEMFKIGRQQTKCELRVDPLPHFAYSYSLLVDGKPLEKFTETQSRTLRSWSVLLKSKRYRIVLEKHTLDVWVNGIHTDVESIFVDQGTEMRFILGNDDAVIKAVSSDRKQGIRHELYVAGKLIQEDME